MYESYSDATMLHENEREMFSSETLFYSDGYLKHIEWIGMLKKGLSCYTW